MSEPGRTDEPSLLLSAAQRVDAIAYRFEKAWKAAAAPEQRPCLADYLGDSPEPERSALLSELIALDIAYRRRAGENPQAEDYRPYFASLDQLTGGEESDRIKQGAANWPGETSLDPLRTGPYEPPVNDLAALGEFAPGTMLKDRYLLESVLGRGGMGQVYLASDQVLHRPVAVKVIRPRDPELRNRTVYEAGLREAFAEEARIGANLTHPAIATVFDFGFHAAEPFIVFEYIQGETLRQLLNRRGRLPVEEVRLIVGPLAQALDFAHTHHVVHRDLKPENIRATLQGHFKILDLGLAKEFRHAVDWSFAGTPRYASPEQAEGLPCDGRTDQYALALITYEMITGHKVFEHTDPKELLKMHRSQEPSSPQRFLPDLPERICAVLARALQKEPNRRFATCEEFAVALGCRFLNAPGSSPEFLREAVGLKMSGQWGLRWRASRTLLVLTADSLWASHDVAVIRWPLQAITEIEGGEPENLLSVLNPFVWGRWLYLRLGTDSLLRQSFKFYTDEECKQWRDDLQALRKELQNPVRELDCEPREEAVVLAPHRPSVRYQLLGTVEASDSERWRAEARLRIRAAMLGADAVVDFKEERLPDLRYTSRWLSGTAVRTVDAAGRSELRSRWLAGQLAWISWWMLVLTGVSFINTLLGSFLFFGVLGIGPASAIGGTMSKRLMLLALVVALMHSWPLAVTLLLRWLLWPQLLRPAVLAFLALVAARPLAGSAGAIAALAVTGKGQGILFALFPLLTFLDPLAFAILAFSWFVCRKAWRTHSEYYSLVPVTQEQLPPLRRIAKGLTLATSLLFGVLLCAWVGYGHFSNTAFSGNDPRKERQALDYFNQGLAKMTQQPQEAEQAFRRALSLWQELTRATPSRPEYQHSLAVTYHNLGWLLTERARVSEAEQAYRDALVHYDKLGANFPAYRNHQKDRDQAKQALTQLAIWKPSLEAAAEQQEGQRLEAIGQHQAAANIYRRGLERHEQRRNEFTDHGNYVQLLASKQNRLAWFLVSCADMQVRNPIQAVEV